MIAIENVRLFDEIQDKNRQLAEASQHKSQFVSSMSHELRTPLNAIIGLTEMMVSNAARFGTEKALEPLQRVNRAGQHLLGLINQVLDLSKIEAGKLELNPQAVQLRPLIDEVVGTARQLAEQNKNRLVVEAQDDLGTLTVDPMRLDGQVAAEHAHTGVAALASCSNDDRLARQNAELMHHDMVKFDEHVALLQLVPSCAATHVAIQSGAWTDPQTWRDGKVPDANARVVIPDAVTVRLEQKIGDVLEWIRVDGRLSFAAHVDTALS